MSYTLRGRIESRLAATLPALAVALAVHRWWAIELVALMLALGLALDVLVYHRALPYQPGWAGLPLGALELGLVYAAMRAIPLHAPLRPALALYAFAWVAAQICGHALFPRFQLSYAEDGGELRRAGPVTAISVAAVLACTAGVAYAMRPPTVHLRGVHRGPLVVSHAETLTGGVVHGTIVVRSSHVTVRNVTVVAGEYGIVVEDARDVKLENVRVVGASLDGIHVRHSPVEIRDCMLTSPRGPWTQGIDISFGGDLGMSMVEGCTVVGAREGIVTHFSQVVVRENRIVDAR